MNNNEKFATLMIEFGKVKKNGSGRRDAYVNIGHIAKGRQFQLIQRKPQQVINKEEYIINPYSWTDFIDESDINRIIKGGTISVNDIINRAKERKGVDITPYLPPVKNINGLITMAIEDASKRLEDEFTNKTGKFKHGIVTDNANLLQILRENSMPNIYRRMGWDPREVQHELDSAASEAATAAEFVKDLKINNPELFNEYLKLGRAFEAGEGYLNEEEQEWNDELERKLGIPSDAAKEFRGMINPLAISDKTNTTYPVGRDIFGQTIQRTFNHFDVDQDGVPIRDEKGNYKIIQRTLPPDKYIDLVNKIRIKQLIGLTKHTGYRSNKEYLKFAGGGSPIMTLKEAYDSPYFRSQYSLANVLGSYKDPIFDSDYNDLRFTTPEDFENHYAALGHKIKTGQIIANMKEDDPHTLEIENETVPVDEDFLSAPEKKDRYSFLNRVDLSEDEK